MSRYIIKNCEQIHSSDNFCWSRNVFCQDCTDCVMKQIYFIAKESLKECENCGTFIHECDGCEFNNSSVLNNILQLLDIQEIE